MNGQKDIAARDALEKDRFAVELSVRKVMSVLDRYIPQGCFKEAEDELFKAFFISGTELVSNDMRKQYEEWKKRTLDAL